MDSMVPLQNIENKIYTIRGLQVMLDRDLASLYNVETKRLNEQVKRNIQRFPNEFMFQLTKEELENWKSQFATSNKETMGLRKEPFAFTEQGVSMLSAVIKSKTAIDMSINIIKSFVNMKRFLSNNAQIFNRLISLEKQQLSTNTQIDNILNAIEDKSIKPKQGIFYNGQIFDAYTFIADLIREANKSIILIDNFIDDTVLTLFSKNQNINITIYSKTISKQLKLDVEKYNQQYRPIKIIKFENSHDRIIIIDNTKVYHIGASLKDLGKKWFAFSKFDLDSVDILGRLK